MSLELARFYLRLLRQSGREIRLSAWWNYVRKTAFAPVCQRFGPDRLPFGPVRIYMLITRACNRRCAFCSCRDELLPASSRDGEMKLAVFSRLLDTRRVREALALNLGGGEPLLHRDLPRMIGMAREKGHLVTIETNGVLLAQKLPEWRHGHPHALSISYDKAVEESLAEGVSAVSDDIILKMSLVLSRKRLGQMPAFFEFARRHRVTFLELANLQPSPDREDEPVREGDVMFQRLKAECEKEYGRGLVVFWPPLMAAVPQARRPRCEMPWVTMTVDEEGRVIACCTLPPSRSHVTALEGRPWNSPELVSVRNGLRLGRPPSWRLRCPYLHYTGLP